MPTPSYRTTPMCCDCERERTACYLWLQWHKRSIQAGLHIVVLSPAHAGNLERMDARPCSHVTRHPDHLVGVPGQLVQCMCLEASSNALSACLPFGEHGLGCCHKACSHPPTHHHLRPARVPVQDLLVDMLAPRVVAARTLEAYRQCHELLLIHIYAVNASAGGEQWWRSSE